MAAPSTNLHFVLFPYMDPGHMLPMVDIARIIAQRGATVTIITTPAVANRSRPVIDRAIEAKLKIQLLELPLPLAEVGLPEWIEDFITSQTNSKLRFKTFRAMELLEKPAEDLLRELATPPDCIISDFFLPWTTDVARRFNIPRLVFHGTGCFYNVCMEVILSSNMLEEDGSTDQSDDTEPMVLPGLPHRVEITKRKITGSSDHQDVTNDEFFVRAILADKASYGIVVNSFEESEPGYAKELSKIRDTKVWCIGPVSLCNKDDQDIAERGSRSRSKLAANSSIDDHHNDCLQWLDKREAESVLYVCLGSVAHVSTQQSIALGLGLESTNRPFIWCVRNRTKELEEWFLEQGFEERVRDRGLMVHGWAPQVLILSHPAIGGFLTHCGWNSTLETICAGVPVITWPFYADQFFNKICLVEILEIGASLLLGVEEPVIFGDIEKMEPLVKKEDVKTAVERLLDDEHDGKGMRERARKLAEMAKRAMAEGRGSSYINVSKLIQDVSDFRLPQ